MIRHIFSTLCNQTSIDKETNSLSIFNIIEQITIYTEPEKTIQLPMHFEIISQWMRSNNDTPSAGKAKVFLCDPHGVSKIFTEIDIDLTRNVFARTIIKVSGIELRGPGIYEVHIELLQEDGIYQLITTLPFQVTFKAPRKKRTN